MSEQRRDEPPAPALRANERSMNADAHAVLRSLVPVVCPPEAAPHADSITDRVVRMIATTPPLVGRALALGLATYDVGALLRHRRRARSLSGAAAERYFASWEHGPTPLHREFARAVNQLVTMSCYEEPAMMEAVGYRPAPWIAEVRRRRLTVYADDVRRQEQQVLAPDPLRPNAVVHATQRRARGGA
jgi:hypothetical protein